MIARIFLAFLLKLFLDIPLMLLGYLIFPLAYRQRVTKDNKAHFPRWAFFWDNADHGIDGENFWAKRTVGWPYWARCFWWTVVRNPTFNWTKYVIGYTSKGTPKRTLGTLEPIGDKKGDGWYYARESWAFEVYFVKSYTLFGKRKCIRFRCGWKIDGKKAGEVCQFCFAPSLMMTYEGK